MDEPRILIIETGDDDEPVTVTALPAHPLPPAPSSWRKGDRPEAKSSASAIQNMGGSDG